MEKDERRRRKMKKDGIGNEKINGLRKVFVMNEIRRVTRRRVEMLRDYEIMERQ